MTLLIRTILCLFIFLSSATFAQIHCGNVELDVDGNSNALLTFDEFSKYNAGMTINNALTLKVKVDHQAIPDPACSWFLNMEVFNNPIAGTPPAEWEELLQYGSGSATNPTLDILEIRVRNSCATSPINGTFQTFSNNGDIMDIIQALLPVTPAGSCTTNVNGPGDYNTNYDEYTFTVDIRVKPNLTFNPGIYEMSVRFHLEENL
ncbi:MAG: hypothetical protein HKN39_00050 [Flavobacteriales bacterium]|nr:hypothetical protein [Flavobacteriales bacterium]